MVTAAYRIQCIDVSKCFGTTTVLSSVDWTVEPGSAVGLIGASGAGKTTLLRVIAGLERCSSGRVVLDGRRTEAGEQKPVVGMVFQNLALWPHLTARRQVEYVLGSLPRQKRRQRAEEALGEARLPEAAWDRRPAELSGGEAQRLALARALAPRPGVLLLDEPLAQVDAALRAELLELLADVIAARAVTAVYVTHHAGEAMALARRIAVMHEGRIAAEGTAEETFWNAPSLEIARLTGPLVRLPKTLFSEGGIALGNEAMDRGRPPWQDDTSAYVRPQQIRLTEPQGKNRWSASESRPDGPGWRVVLHQGPAAAAVYSPEPVQPGTSVGIEVLPRPAGDCPRPPDMVTKGFG